MTSNISWAGASPGPYETDRSSALGRLARAGRMDPRRVGSRRITSLKGPVGMGASKPHKQFVAAIKDLADPAAVAEVSRFFWADPEGCSGDNKVLGVSIGKVFPVAK